MAADTPLLRLRDAVVVRGGKEVLRIDELELRAGEHVALLGPNGSGKSTLVGLVTRDFRPLHREEPPVLLLGRERWDLFEARRLFGVVSDRLQESYARRVSVRDAVLSGYFGSIGLYRRGEVTPAMSAKAEEVLALVGMDALAGRSMHELSTGETRRALIARALVHDPPALLLDEPAHGLDPVASRRLTATLRELARRGRAIVLVTHHVEEVFPEVGRVVMLRRGRVFADGPPSALLTSATVSELFEEPLEVEHADGVYRLR